MARQHTEMGRLLEQLNRQWGTQKLLTQKEFFIQRLVDAYQPSLKTACILVERAMDFGLGSRLYQLWLKNGGNTISSSDHDALITHLVTKADFSQNKAALTVGFFDEMLGWEIVGDEGKAKNSQTILSFVLVLFVGVIMVQGLSPDLWQPQDNFVVSPSFVCTSTVLPITPCPTSTPRPTAVPTSTPLEPSHVAPQEVQWSMYPSFTRYEYHQLSYDEKRVFSAIYDACARGRTVQIELPDLKLSKTSRDRIRHTLYYDCPELMLTRNHYMEIFHWLADKKIDIDASLASDLQENNRRLQKLIPIFAQIRSDSDFGTTDYEHQLAVDRFIVQNCRYELDIDDNDEGYLDSHRIAYAAFLTKRAVCEGYARSAQLALRYFSIPTIYVIGDTSDGIHAWNLVEINDNWYQYDPTWNDSDESTKVTDYFPSFNLTDTQMLALRTYDSCYTELGFFLPSCYSTNANYYARQGRLLGSDWKSQLVSQLADERRKGNKYIGFGFRTLQDYEAAVKAVKGNRLSIKGRYYYYWVDDMPFLYFIFK